MSTSHEKCNSKPPDLLECKDVLGEHLYIKVLNICTCESLAQKVTGVLLECEKEEVYRMLVDEDFLKKRITLTTETLQKCGLDDELEKAVQVPASKGLSSTVTDELFDKVCQLEPALSSEITGMLLEADCDHIEKLLCSPSDLKKAVEQARLSLSAAAGSNNKELSESEEDLNSDSTDSLAEQVYEEVEHVYPDPDTASRITGMLMELDTESLQQLIGNRQAMTSKIKTAYNVLHQT